MIWDWPGPGDEITFFLTLIALTVFGALYVKDRIATQREELEEEEAP